MTERTSPRSGTAAERAAPPTAVAVVTRPSDRRAIEAACRKLGLELLALLRQAEPDAQPVLGRALDAVADGRAGCLVVRRLSDLDSPPGALPDVVARIEEEELRVVVLDVGLDTTEPTGRLALRPRERRGGPGSVPPSPSAHCIGYTCAAPEGRAAELAGDREALERAARREDLELLEVVGDRTPRYGKALDRPGLAHVLERLAAGEATCLVVTHLDHLSHSVAELGRLMAWLEERGMRLIALEPRIDTGSAAGREAARALVSIGGWERERLSERTRAGLAAADARRHAGGGPEVEGTAALRQRIREMRERGMTLQAIADALNAEGVPTLRGGTTWRPSSVQSVVSGRRSS